MTSIKFIRILHYKGILPEINIFTCGNDKKKYKLLTQKNINFVPDEQRKCKLYYP